MAILFAACLLAICCITAYATQTDNSPQKGGAQILQSLSDLPQITVPTVGKQLTDDIIITEDSNPISAQLDYMEQMSAFRAHSDLSTIRTPFQNFVTKTIPYAFADTNHENRIYSPISAYATLCILAECGSLDTDMEILTFCELNPEQDTSINVLQNLIYGLQFSENEQTLQLANSLWFDKSITDAGGINQNVIDLLQTQGNVSSYQVTMSSSKATEQMKLWSKQATDGTISIDPVITEDTLAILISALYFKDGWRTTFQESLTQNDAVFTNGRGMIETVSMMHRSEKGKYTETEQYRAAELLSEHGAVRFFLPSDNTNLSDLMQDTMFLNEIVSPDLFSDKQTGQIIWSVPKFEADTNIDLLDMLQKVGLDMTKTEYTALSTISVELSEIQQISHVKVNEDGFEAAAVTYASLVAMSAMPEPLPEIPMTLDKPFGFIIFSQDMPLFIGCITTIE